MTYTVRAVNMPETEVRIGRLFDALAWARALHREHPNRWVDVRDDDDELMLLLDPKVLTGSPIPHTQLELE